MFLYHRPVYTCGHGHSHLHHLRVVGQTGNRELCRPHFAANQPANAGTQTEAGLRSSVSSHRSLLGRLSKCREEVDCLLPGARIQAPQYQLRPRAALSFGGLTKEVVHSIQRSASNVGRQNQCSPKRTRKELERGWIERCSKNTIQARQRRMGQIACGGQAASSRGC
jgi:hypothetical protein